MTRHHDSYDDYQRWQERVWQEMEDRAERAKTLQLMDDVRAVEANPPDPVLRARLLAIGESDEDILYSRLVLRRQAITDGKTHAEALVMADKTLTEYLDEGILPLSKESE
jgi:hypothetical protein